MARPPIRDPKKDDRALLGRALKRLRKAAGYTTQAAFAARLDGYGEDSVQKSETGYQFPTTELVARWLEACNTTDLDRELIADLYEHAEEAESVIPQFAQPWLHVEPEASFIRAWALDVLPGQFQTYGYAHAMFLKGGLDEGKATERATARVNRAKILDGPDSTRFTALLYQPILYRQVGTPETMSAQHAHLLELSERPNVMIQVVQENDYFPGHNGQFQIASGRTIPDTLNMITIRDQTTSEPVAVEEAALLFDEIRGYAVNVAESRTLIQEALRKCEGQQQVPAGASPVTATAVQTIASK